jgi:5-methylcytosine-specific restriction endonuclease McrBC GTP-binding regulatory subunit McrB
LKNISLNTILYGVAGTGKTYNTAIYAVAIVENRTIEDVSKMGYSEVLNRFKEYKSRGIVENITFHQSYSYEDFIEGIKPTLNSTEVSYKLQDGIFKSFCKGCSPFNFLVGQDVSSKSAKHCKYIVDSVTSESIYIRKFRLGSGQDGKILSIPLSLVANLTESIKRNEITIMDLKSSNLEASSNYDLSIFKYYGELIANLVEKSLLYKDTPSNSTNRVFIIDEINRANISNVFGELITLIEPTKRLGNAEALRVKLPYSNELFGVPNNVYILGTMNSTDHSTVTLDTALRRRFDFVEVLPNYGIFKDVFVEGVSIYTLFKNINLRIAYLIGNDYLIGHTYFLELLQSPTIEVLSKVFRCNILPLLEEYFYNDYAKVRLVLADNQTDVLENQFILEKFAPNELFHSTDFDLNPIYEINLSAFENIESYRKV